MEKFAATAIFSDEFNKILRQLDAPGLGEEEEESDLAWSRAKHVSKTERRRREKLRKLRLP